MKECGLIGNSVAVSIIIPTFNQPERLLLLLKSLENQSVDNFEVIVVDDGSTDGTRQEVCSLMADYPVPLQYHYLDNTDIFGAGIARNYGAKQAKGEILLFLDQDCVAQKDLLKKHICHHKTKDIILGYFAGYGYEKECYDFSELKERVRQKKTIPIIKEFRDHLFERASKDDVWKCFASGHFSVKKEIFEKFYFDESLIQWGGEDVDLGYRLFKAGKTINFERDCVVYNSCEEFKYKKEKISSLAESLVYTYNKHQTDEIKLYCLERFYHVPLKYRGSSGLIFENNSLKVKKTQTKIAITKDCRALIVVGEDFIEMADTIEQIFPLIRRVYFDVAIIKTFKKQALLDFKESYCHLLKVLKDKKVDLSGSVE